MKRTKFIASVAVAACFTIVAASSADAARVLVDFGRHNGNDGEATVSPDTNGNYWNNVSYGAGDFQIPAGASWDNLVTTSNDPTTIDVVTNTIFRANGYNNGGLLAPSAALLGDLAISTATGDYFFTETGGTPALNNYSELKLTGLSANATYDLRMFATRKTTSERTTRYEVTDANGLSNLVLQTSGPGIGDGGYDGNNDTIVGLAGLVPDGNNEITIGVRAIDGGYAYIGILDITENAAVPEPTSLVLIGIGGLVCLARRRFCQR